MAASAIVSHALARSTYPILLPAMADELVANNRQAGALTTINFAGYLVGVLAVTIISGRVEPGRLLVGGLATATSGFVLLAIAADYPTLAVGLALAGLGSAGIWMSAPVLATAAVPERRRGTVMGVLSASMGLGIVTVSQATNVVRAISDDPGSWRPLWAAAAAFAAVVAATVAIGLRLPDTARVAGGLSLARLRTVPGWSTLIAAYWCSGMVVSGFTPFLGVALEEAGFGRSHVGNLFAVLGLSAVIGAVALGRISDHVGRRPVLQGAMAATAAASLLVLTEAEPFATVAVAAFGAASFTFPVIVTAYLSDHLQGRAFSNALGALTLFYGTALILGPLVAGALGDSRAGFPAVFVMTATFSLLSATLLFGIDRDRTGGEALTGSERRTATAAHRRAPAATGTTGDEG